MIVRWAVFVSACVTLAACSGGHDPAADDADLTAAASKYVAEPWEIISNKGETYLPNVFYADASQNEQIMPYALGGHVMIDRLVYPTLGNPNLYVRGDATDEFTIVLRVEDATPESLSFYAVPRSARAVTETTTHIDAPGVVRIVPDAIEVLPESDDMPAVLKQRHTVRVTFRQKAMAQVAPGLYDVRFEQKVGGTFRYEYQYNALSVFETEPDEYKIIDVTDTQVAVAALYAKMTRDKLDEFVNEVNTSPDPNIRDAAVITCNGDLHNGGSPGRLGQAGVATQYSDEAKAIVDQLKWLTKPIFLTTGNHDGLVNTGQVPAVVATVDWLTGPNLHTVISRETSPWANFDIDKYEQWLAATKAQDQLGGAHYDVVTGTFSRTSTRDGWAGWKELAKRNYILVDGFHQWQKTYGPLYYSWRFGKNAYLSLNSFDLRQHKRSGWGMYVVNYGGGVSDVQMKWVDRELARAKSDGRDAIVLAHHDPRGGHAGKDHGYYFDQIDYRSIYQSSINYISAVYLDPQICKLPSWALSQAQQETCLHDGLQEWMRPDPELDCDWDHRKPDFTCQPGALPYTSGVELMKRIANSDSVRTLLLGHTHYNELEVLQHGDEIFPEHLPIDAQSVERYATLEVTNPFRGFAVQQHELLPRNDYVLDPTADYDNAHLPIAPLEEGISTWATTYDHSLEGWSRSLGADGSRRELVILRFVSNADLADQTYSSKKKSAMGFGVLEIAKVTDARGFSLPQVNHAHFYANVGSSRFQQLTTIDLDRTSRLAPRAPENPLTQLYTW